MSFEKTEIRRQRTRLMVRFCLSGGAVVEGDVFVTRGERVSDLLNDSRAFIPVDTGTGEVIVLAKAQIASAHILSAPAAHSEDDADPFAVLRVDPRASDAELRAAWMTRLKACHPDRLAALQLDPEILVAARRVAQRINAAYDRVTRERRGNARSAS